MMKVFYGVDNLPLFSHVATTVGSFDGIHEGHSRLLKECVATAKSIGGESVVLTFEPHPRIALGLAEELKLLTTLDEKIYLLNKIGVDNLIVIPFDKSFSLMSYYDFVREILIGRIGTERLIVGYNHHFGRNNEGDYSRLQTLQHEFEFQVNVVDKIDVEQNKVSSTVIRRTIETGDMSLASRLLGHPYIIIGDVDADGIIAPLEPMKLLPPNGNYAVTVNNSNDELHIGQKISIAQGRNIERAVIKFI